jgi:hypothetical protein
VALAALARPDLARGVLRVSLRVRVLQIHAVPAIATAVGVGGVLAGAAVTTVGMLFTSNNRSDWSSYQVLCDQGLRSDAQCQAEQPGIASSVWAGAGITVGSAIAIPVGLGMKKRAHHDLAQRANEVLR